MRIASIFVIAMAIGTGIGAGLESKALGVAAGGTASAAVVDGASNAAFRDGLYQAKLAAEHGSESTSQRVVGHPTKTGRHSQQDMKRDIRRS